MAKVRDILKVLDLANFKIKAEKGKIARSQMEWPGFRLTKTCVSLVNNKLQGIKDYDERF